LANTPAAQRALRRVWPAERLAALVDLALVVLAQNRHTREFEALARADDVESM
jgi:hypothetical protein